MKRMTGAGRLSPKALGIVVLVGFLLVGWAAFKKETLDSFLTFGEESIKAEFDGRSKLIDDSLTYVHNVKLNGVEIGKVTDIERTDAGTMMATLQVESGTREKLGTVPTAFLEPTLVTDGVQYIGLERGGEPGAFTEETIPLDRTRLPVYLDDVLGAVSTDDAKKGIQAAIGQTEQTLEQGGTDAIQSLVKEAPDTLEPAAVVLDAFRGTEPGNDLTRLVTSLESAASAFNEKDGQFESIIDSLEGTTAALAAGSEPLAEAVADGPQTLQVSEAGLADLQVTLDKLTTTAEEFRPSARQLSSFLAELDPVLVRTRPVVGDLRALMDDARPLIERLVPTAEQSTEVLEDLRGPVLDRLNGRIKETLYSPFKGENEYEGGGSAIPLYKEIGYLLNDSSDVWSHYGPNTAIARLMAGAGGQSVGGSDFPMTIEQYLESMGLQQPIGPQEGPGSQVGEDGNEEQPGPLPTPDDEIDLVPEEMRDLPIGGDQ